MPAPYTVDDRDATKPWLAAYPAGVPAHIDPHRYRSLADLLTESCARYRTLPALDSMGATLTYSDLERLSRHFAACLQQDGIGRGDRVAVMLPNVLQYPVVLFGALRAGAVIVNVNPMYTANELSHELDDSGATVIVVLEQFARTLELALPGTAVRRVIVTGFADLFPAYKRHLVNFLVRRAKRVPPWRIPGAVRLRHVLANGRRRPASEVALDPDDVAFLQYTGGTTGRPKGVILTHGNLLANVEQTAAWMKGALEEGRETVVTALPLYHIFALTANLLVFLKLGGNDVLIADPRDLRRFIATLKKSRFTAITGVNTLYKALLDAPGFAEVALAARGVLKIAVAGGMALERTVAERWQALTGVPLIEGYGLSEASPIVCANPPDIRAYTGKIGLPVPSTEVAIVDDGGTGLPAGEVGEIAVRGPQVMRGYWRAPEDTRDVLTPDGWLRTGDMGRMDERGYVEFIDRKKEVIVVSGFKAYPAEIEAVVRLHPGVSDAAAVGVPDAHSGEAVALVVVRRDGSVTAQALWEHCREHLTRYKLPHRIEFVGALPKSPLGKTLRREVREALLESTRDAEVQGVAK